jgi:hypothetical protein
MNINLNSIFDIKKVIPELTKPFRQTRNTNSNFFTFKHYESISDTTICGNADDYLKQMIEEAKLVNKSV